MERTYREFGSFVWTAVRFKCENIQHGAIAGAPPIAGAEKIFQKIFCHKFVFPKNCSLKKYFVMEKKEKAFSKNKICSFQKNILSRIKTFSEKMTSRTNRDQTASTICIVAPRPLPV